MKYKNIAITSLVIILLFVFIIAYFCFTSLSASFGYKNTWDETEYYSSINPSITIIVDAGHGGIDPGAVGNGLVEKELNLAVAKKLEAFIKLSGANVILTRRDDILLGDGDTVRQHKTSDLKERIRIMNETDNSLFVSIHMNKFSAPLVHGMQTFYASKVQGSDLLAQKIQETVKLFDKSNNRTIKPDDNNIYILENATKTAVLVECGFISNEKEAALLSSDDYQNKIAFAIYTGIINYIQEMGYENSVYLR